MLSIVRGSARAVALGIFAGATQLVAQSPTRELTFDPQRLARLDSFIVHAVADQRIAGAVLVVRHRGKVAYEKAFGWQDREAKIAMTPKTIFRIASQTKALTSVAIMSLVEEGRIGLNDPVSKWIPSFARTTVAIKTDTGRAIVPARRAITIRDLLTHTAGISYGTDSLVAPLYAAKGLGPAAGWGWYTADKNEPVCETMDRLGTLPFVAQPGTAFVYGYNTDILGCVAERASGKPLDQLIAERITTPLGMKDTHFFLPDADRGRLAVVYASDTANHAVLAPTGPRGQGDYVTGPRRSFAGGAGLLSTASDYATFLQMLLNGGAAGTTRILGPRTIAAMTSNESGTLYSSDGRGFGYGFSTVDRPGADGFASVGTYAWGGAYGSQYFVDPAEGLVVSFMVQLIPSRWSERDRIYNLIYQALVPTR
jgi:CubicO group peptidase (beta-lactamase class C family)